ncbi:hypothetical protein SteCoe_12565 [Stentor coeruleus]|uniref:PX domain-containing protein n=1 Tax=Stentor coeruleus TaxID=5963 RepID=A0A1R2CAG8_9CILI|nr:hypothetical protein SteCoe_12565 [Stentor coeruleus]
MEDFNRNFMSSLTNPNILNYQSLDSENIEVTYDKTEGSKVVQFTISIKDNNQEYHVKRSLNDFKHLRDTILSVWGGMIIPSLPIQKTPIKSIENPNDIGQIQLLIKNLKKFLKECIKNKHFSSLQVFTTFLTDNQAYNPPKYSLKDIEHIISNFYSNVYTEKDIVEKIEALKKDCKAWEEYLDNIKEINFRLKLQENTVNANRNAFGLNEFYANDIFSAFYKWAGKEILNINKIIEAYLSLIDFQILLETLQQKVEQFSLGDLENYSQNYASSQENLKSAILIISNLLFIFPQSDLISLLASKTQSLDAFLIIRN